MRLAESQSCWTLVSFAARAASLTVRLGCLLLLPLLGPRVANATTLDGVDYSADVTVALGGATVVDEDVALDDLLGTVTLASLGALPGATDVVAYHLLDDGDQLIAFDTTVSLTGGLTARPGDVVRFDGATYTPEFDASSNELPAGVQTDAVGMLGQGDLLLSFDTTVAVDGITVQDEDVVAFDGQAFTLFFDASTARVATALDLDAVHYLNQNGNILVSFDGSGTVDALPFDDEDVLEYDPVDDVWALAYDGSVEHAEWPAADLDALHATPTPVCMAGECNGDDMLTTADVTCIILRLFDQIPMTSACEDCNADGLLTTADVTCAILCLFDLCPGG